MSWTNQSVGMLWWDLTRAKFLDNRSSDSIYRTSAWNTLYKTASIDIYEWVESKHLPSEWDRIAASNNTFNISGTSKYGDLAYSVKKRYDSNIP